MHSRTGGLIGVVTAVWLLASCSVISENIREEALTEVGFHELTRNVQAYVGQTVILGGIILDIQNMPDKTQLLVLETPLGYRDRPESKDESRGRFLAVQEGFLDPEVFEKGRKVTIAGTVMGTETVTVDNHSLSLLQLDAREIHLWTGEEDDRAYYPYYDPFYWPPPYTPYYWHRPGPWGPYRYW